MRISVKKKIKTEEAKEEMEKAIAALTTAIEAGDEHWCR